MSEFSKFPVQLANEMPIKSRKVPVTTVAGGAGATAIAAIPVPIGAIVFAKATLKANDATAGHYAIYEVVAAAKNIAGTTALIGASSNPVALEDDATWAAAFAANNTDDTIDLQVTPDGSNDTDFEGVIEYITVRAVVAAS